MCSCTERRACWPSSRPSVVVKELKEPASMLVVPPVRDGENGSVAPEHGLAVRARCDLKARGGVDGAVAVPRRERRVGGVGAAARRGRERCAFFAEEVQFGVFEGQLGAVRERGCQLPGRGVQGDFARELYDGPGDGVGGDQVNREQAAEGVLVLGGDVHRAGQRVRQQGRGDPDRGDLRSVRTEGVPRLEQFRGGRGERGGPGTRLEFLKAGEAGQILRAGFKAARARGVQGHAFGQRDRDVLDRGLGEAFRVEHRRLGDVHVGQQPARTRRLRRGRARA